MADGSATSLPAVERTPPRGMTFPFFLSLVLFVAVVTDVWLGDRGFIVSAAYRQQPYIFLGSVILGLMLWLWVLAAARRRGSRFDGPIEVSRGSNGALQPILATVFLVSGINLAYSHATFAPGATAPKPIIHASATSSFAWTKRPPIRSVTGRAP
jgi:hypothetical protein